MGSKSEQKKEYIIRTARGVFEKKGYKDVTMKDIVEACDISRGGLYLYFSSTEDILLEAIALDTESDGAHIGIKKGMSASDLLFFFLKEQKKDILGKENSMLIALYEYYFSKEESNDNILKKQFDMCIKIIRKLIKDGNACGDFRCKDPAGAATNIMFAIEGMKIVSRTMGIKEADVNSEFVHIMKGLV